VLCEDDASSISPGPPLSGRNLRKSILVVQPAADRCGNYALMTRDLMSGRDNTRYGPLRETRNQGLVGLPVGRDDASLL
jgi:hypothetical protein